LRNNIDKIAAAINPLSELIRLRQATGYTGILSSTIQESAKLDRMDEIVEEAIANNRKVVIFSNWTQMTDAIYERLHQKYPLSLITGATKDELRQHNVEQFQHGDSKIIIGTIGAMGTGLTLTAGTVVIFMDHPWTRALYDQAVDRCHRIGQNSSITVYNLMCKDTIDERIWGIVKTKGALSDQIVDGKIQGNKTETLLYLLGSL
jgi:SNF2 family DNA or RNA helicase